MDEMFGGVIDSRSALIYCGVVKIIARNILISVGMALLGFPALASITPYEAECTAQIKVLEKSDTRQVIFEIMQTNCDGLTIGKRYTSSTMDEPALLSIVINTLLDGEVARSSTMGPNGVVRWFKFSYPDFGHEQFNFTAGY